MVGLSCRYDWRTPSEIFMADKAWAKVCTQQGHESRLEVKLNRININTALSQIMGYNSDPMTSMYYFLNFKVKARSLVHHKG